MFFYIFYSLLSPDFFCFYIICLILAPSVCESHNVTYGMIKLRLASMPHETHTIVGFLVTITKNPTIAWVSCGIEANRSFVIFSRFFAILFKHRRESDENVFRIFRAEISENNASARNCSRRSTLWLTRRSVCS